MSFLKYLQEDKIYYANNIYFLSNKEYTEISSFINTNIIYQFISFKIFLDTLLSIEPKIMIDNTILHTKQSFELIDNIKSSSYYGIKIILNKIRQISFKKILDLIVSITNANMEIYSNMNIRFIILN